MLLMFACLSELAVMGIASQSNPHILQSPLQVTSTTVYVGGFVCGVSQSALAIYPVNTETVSKYPLIVFGHGAGATPGEYSVLLETTASWGFVIVSPFSAETSWCETFYKDQLRVISYAYSMSLSRTNNTVWDGIDWSRKVGLMGHSMGGFASLIAAEYAGPADVGATVSIAPFWDGMQWPSVYSSSAMFLVAGGNDTVSVPDVVKGFYLTLPTSISRAIAIPSGLDHTSVFTNFLLNTYHGAFFDCHLRGGIAGGCQAIYSDSGGYNWSPLCTNDYIPMEYCAHQATDYVSMNQSVYAGRRRKY